MHIGLQLCDACQVVVHGNNARRVGPSGDEFDKCRVPLDGRRVGQHVSKDLKPEAIQGFQCGW